METLWFYFSYVLFIVGRFFSKIFYLVAEIFGPSVFTKWYFFAKLWALFHSKHLVTLISSMNHYNEFSEVHLKVPCLRIALDFGAGCVLYRISSVPAFFCSKQQLPTSVKKKKRQDIKKVNDVGG